MSIYYIDGGSRGNEQIDRARSARIAVAYSESADRVDPSKIEVYWGAVGDKTNNEAEYLALLKALDLITQKSREKLPGAGGIVIRSDSKLVVNQVKGEWHVKEPRLVELNDKARDSIGKLRSIRVEWVPREENYAGLWIEGKLRPLRVHRLPG